MTDLLVSSHSNRQNWSCEGKFVDKLVFVVVPNHH